MFGSPKIWVSKKSSTIVDANDDKVAQTTLESKRLSNVASKKILCFEGIGPTQSYTEQSSVQATHQDEKQLCILWAAFREEGNSMLGSVFKSIGWGALFCMWEVHDRHWPLVGVLSKYTF